MKEDNAGKQSIEARVYVVKGAVTAMIRSTSGVTYVP